MKKDLQPHFFHIEIITEYAYNKTCMNNKFLEVRGEIERIIRNKSRPLIPLPTNVVPKRIYKGDFSAVLFDIYGTLFISGSGDIGTIAKENPAAVFSRIFEQCGINPCGEQTSRQMGEEAHTLFYRIIEKEHKDGRSQGVDYPEVDIIEVWEQLLLLLHEGGHICGLKKLHDISFVCAIEYETAVNPVWPMPHALEIIQSLNNRGIHLGLISNAQIFTPLLFNVFFGDSSEGLGFNPSLCFFSFKDRTAKPSLKLFQSAQRELTNRWGIDPSKVLYVGNDMLNDIYPASRIGFKTALFAGDQRSLRLRPDDERCKTLQPDIIVTNLKQIAVLFDEQERAYSV